MPKTKRVFFLRIPPGEDLVEWIEKFCAKKGLRFCLVSGIGALEPVTIGYYDQRRKKYKKTTIKKEMELLSLSGNVSLKDGKPFLHGHVTLSDTKGRAFGGHLFAPTGVFVAEVCLIEISGKPPVRKFDPYTSLALWPA